MYLSYWNCHIIREDEGRGPWEKEDVMHEFSHTSMLQFCEYLYHDILRDMDEWISFISYFAIDCEWRKKTLTKKLICLKK